MSALDRLRELARIGAWPVGEEAAQMFPDLLAVVEAARHLSRALENDYYPDKHGMLARDLADALAPLTTDSEPK